MTRIWIGEVNKMMEEDPEKCVALYPGNYKRCEGKNGYGDGDRFCKKHRGVKILDFSGNCFFDMAPRYGD